MAQFTKKSGQWRTLEGQSAIDYIRNKPESLYKVKDYGSIDPQKLEALRQAQIQKMKQTYADQDKGFFGNLIWGLTSPARTVIEGGAGLLGFKPQRAGQSITGLMSQEEIGQAVDNPLAYGTGETLKAWSNLLPTGGLSVAGAAARGAAQGGVYGFGTGLQQSRGDLGKALVSGGEGALYGGLTGGALKGAANIARGTKNLAGNVLPNLRMRNLGITTPKTPQGAAIKQELERGTAAILDKYKVGYNPKGMSEAYQRLGDELDNVVNARNVKVNKSNIFDDFTNQVSQDVDITKGVAKNNYEQLFKKLGSVKGDVKSMLKFKFDLQDEMGSIYKKEAMGNALTPKEATTKAMHDVVDRYIKTSNPEVGRVLSEMSTLHRAAPDIVKGAAKGQKVGIPMSGLSMNVKPALDVTRTGLSRLANIDVGKVVSPYVKPAVREAIIRGGAVQRGLQPQQQPLEDYSNIPTEELFQMLRPDEQLMYEQQLMSGGQTPQVRPLSVQEALEQARMMGARKLSDQKALAQMLLDENQAQIKAASGGAGAKKTEFQNKLSAAAQSAEQAYNLLEQGGVNLGKIPGYITEPLAEFTGTQSPENVRYRSSVALARTMARNAMLGANMSESELRSIEKFIPEYTDEPEIAKVKLANFIDMLNMISQGNTVPDELVNLSGY